MIMAEGEAMVGGASDGGEGTGTQMVGGSLPPRKRLLAGMKQNGLWLASSSPASPTAPTSLQRIDEGGPVGAGTGSALRPSTREGLTAEAKGGCMSCGAVQSDGWRKAKHNGVVQRLCDYCSCTPPVHLDSDSKVEAGNFAPPAAAERSNPCSKKFRISTESRSKSNDLEGDAVDQFEETCNSTKVLLGRKGSSSKEAAAAAATTAAGLARRTAAAAKASAAAKAATAVRAAAIAKAALDAAALAARVEAHVRGDLLRNSASSERTAVGSSKECQLRKERAEETEVKTEGLGTPADTKLSSIDDEELARQLHRAINSSPRISTGFTTLRRTPSKKPAVIANVSHAVASWPRLGLSPESEPRLLMKQQQTRPRSLQLKEAKLIDYQDVKLEPKQSGGNSRTKVLLKHDAVASSNAAELLALKSEPIDASTITLVRQDSENMLVQGAASASSTLDSKKGNDSMNGATAVLCGLEDNQDQVLSATEVSQADVLLDEVLMSEAEKDDSSKCLSRVHNTTDLQLKEDLDASEATVGEGAISLIHPLVSEERGLDCTQGGGTGNSSTSSVGALVEVASNAIELVETQDTSCCAAVVNGPCSTPGDAGRSEGVSTGALEAPLPTPSRHSKDSSEFESSLESLPQPSVAGKGGEKVSTRGTRQEIASGSAIEHA